MDLDQPVNFCTENSAVLAPEAPIANGRDAIRKSFTGFFALPGLKITWHPDRTEVAKSGEMAYTNGAYPMTFRGPGGKTISDKGTYEAVWKKQVDGSSKVALDIFHTDLPPGA